MDLQQKIKNIFSDPEVNALIFWNVILIIFYQTESLRTSTLIWLFYFQNIFIGIQYYFRIRKLSKNISQEDKQALISRSGIKVTKNGHEVDPMKFDLSTFFVLHFGIFHAVYFIFIFIMTFIYISGTFDKDYFFAGIVFMAINTFLSTKSHFQSDMERKTKPGYIEGLLITPYMRVFPMHFFIMIGFTLMVFLKDKINVHTIFFIFLIFKTISDVWMHVFINKTWLGPRPKAFGDFI